MPRANKLLAFILTAVLVAPLFSQEQSSTVFRADTRLVVLHASVVDKSGKLVTDLSKESFTVFENDIKQEVSLFRREDVPVSLGLIVDNSGSMADKRREVESAALALVKASNPKDEVFIVNFNDEAFLDVDFTSDIRRLEEGLSRIDSRGGTAMRDALSMSIDHVLEKAKHDKKVLLVVTDGNDNTSAMTLEKLINKAQRSEVLIYAVGLLDKEQRRERKRAQRALDSLASTSGGLSYYPKDLEQVEPMCMRVAHEIRNQYVIAYSPTNPTLDGTYRRVRVEARGKGNPTVRTRTGYYATPGQAEAKATSALR